MARAHLFHPRAGGLCPRVCQVFGVLSEGDVAWEAAKAREGLSSRQYQSPIVSRNPKRQTVMDAYLFHLRLMPFYADVCAAFRLLREGVALWDR